MSGFQPGGKLHTLIPAVPVMSLKGHMPMFPGLDIFKVTAVKSRLFASIVISDTRNAKKCHAALLTRSSFPRRLHKLRHTMENSPNQLKHRRAMFRFCLFVVIFLIFEASSAPAPDSDDTTTEAEVPKKPGFGFSIFENSDDAIFGFIKNLLNTGHTGAEVALNRLKNETEKRKKFLDEVRSSLLPTST